MPWYLVHADSGPGHQSHFDFYEYSETVLDKYGREELWMGIFANERYRDPIGKVRRLKGLPESVKKDKISLFQGNIRYYKRILKAAKATPVLKGKS